MYGEHNTDGFLLDAAENYTLFLRLCKNKLHKKLEGDRKAWEDIVKLNQQKSEE